MMKQLPLSLTVLSLLGLSILTQAQVNKSGSINKTGKRGSNVNASGTVGPHRASGTATATGRKGKTATASGSAQYGNGTATYQGTATGPRGKTGTVNGTATYGNGQASTTGTVSGSGKSRTYSGSASKVNGKWTSNRKK